MKRASVVLAAALAAPAFGQASRTLGVTGRASVQVAPDVVRVSYSIVNQGTLKQSIPSLVALNNERVQPTVEHLKRVVGKHGTVRVNPVVQQRFEYNDKTHKNELKGYEVLTQIEVELRGKKAMAGTLSKLYDASAIQADEIGAPAYGLSDRLRQSALDRANRKAVRGAVRSAESQLEEGESLGAALSRGEGGSYSAPRPHAARAAAALESADMGQAAVEAGKLTVTAVTSFVFEVLGAPVRLLSREAEPPRQGPDA